MEQRERRGTEDLDERERGTMGQEKARGAGERETLMKEKEGC